jgi:hypothetical protein
MVGAQTFEVEATLALLKLCTVDNLKKYANFFTDYHGFPYSLQENSRTVLDRCHITATVHIITSSPIMTNCHLICYPKQCR